ncbi:MAG: FAD-dependent oxidoreductase [candidate division KSB1 bacterium]|nr:FAD-dependent oxidoreductase [candidate division KSB1 bacterium]
MEWIPRHVVAIVGGAIAGSEAAYRLSQRGICSVVFEQNALPYGKIEDGLPMWHVKLRDQDESKIDEKLTHPLVYFVPRVRLGNEIDFLDLVTHWGFSAVLLATGAWRDRPLPIAGIDNYIGRGLVYQNSLVHWFNHKHEPNYNGPHFEMHDNALIVGGGLASLDVVKICMLETVLAALRKRGIATDLLTLEHETISKFLEHHQLTLQALGLQGCLLIYRRRTIDMPLADLPADASPERAQKVYQAREKILHNFQAKYLFRFMELTTPVDKIVESDRLVGLKLACTEIKNGQPKIVPGSEFEYRTPMVISSIGSVPEPIAGIPMDGELYKIRNLDTGQLEAFDHVFGLGNVVTGRGNIKASLEHGRQVADLMMDEFLAWRDEDYQELLRRAGEIAGLRAERVIDFLATKKLLSADQIKSIMQRVQTLQQRVGYDGDYRKWIQQHKPVRYEELIGWNPKHA